jgi:hypothetical protein
MARVLLTDRFIASAKSVGTAQQEFFDEKTPGLAPRVTTRGHKSWSFFFTSPKDGRRARVGLGTYPATSLAAARGRGIEARRMIEEHRDPRDVIHDQRTGAMTATDLAESYFEKHVRPNLRSAKAIQRRYQRTSCL